MQFLAAVLSLLIFATLYIVVEGIAGHGFFSFLVALIRVDHLVGDRTCCAGCTWSIQFTLLSCRH